MRQRVSFACSAIRLPRPRTINNSSATCQASREIVARNTINGGHALRCEIGDSRHSPSSAFHFSAGELGIPAITPSSIPSVHTSQYAYHVVPKLTGKELLVAYGSVWLRLGSLNKQRFRVTTLRAWSNNARHLDSCPCCLLEQQLFRFRRWHCYCCPYLP